MFFNNKKVYRIVDMKNLLKSFGKGLLYLIAFPAILVVLSVLAIVGIVIFIVLGIKGAILFFQGKSLFNDLPEDIEVRRLKNISVAPVEEIKPEPSSADVFFTTANSYSYINETESQPQEQEQELEQENNTNTEEIKEDNSNEY